MVFKLRLPQESATNSRRSEGFGERLRWSVPAELKTIRAARYGSGDIRVPLALGAVQQPQLVKNKIVLREPRVGCGVHY